MISRFAMATRISIGLTFTLCACESAPTTPAAPEPVGECARLAQTFRITAEDRDRGSSRASQIEAAQVSIDAGTTPDPDGALRYLIQTIDFVHGRQDMSAQAIEALVRNNCLVNQEGRAVLYLPQP